MDAVPPHVTQIEYCIEAPSGTVSNNDHVIIASGPSPNIARFSEWTRLYPGWKLTELDREDGKAGIAIRAPKEIPWREVASMIFHAQKEGLQTGYGCNDSSNKGQ